MISVKRFMQEEPALLDAVRGFVDCLAQVPDPVVAITSRAKDKQAQIAWTLLGTDIFQDRGYGEITRLLAALYAKFPGEKLWTLPVPTANDINAVVESVFGSRNWSLFEHIAGIFWSVGLFVRRHGDLVQWASERSPEEMWRDLGEIYFMGKGVVRPKVCAAIYRIVAGAPLGLGVHCHVAKNAARTRLRGLPPLPLTMGARRFLAMFSPASEDGFADIEPATKQKLMNEYCREVCPEYPYQVAHSLQFFLEAGKEDFICREKTRVCSECPLYEHCDYALRNTR